MKVRRFAPAAALLALMMTSCTAERAVGADDVRENWPDRAACVMDIEFDCGDRVTAYTLRAAADGDTVRLEVVEPGSLAGLTASVEGDGGSAVLSFGDAVFGVDGFTAGAKLPSPLVTVPALMNAVRDGVVTGESGGRIGTTDCVVIDAAYNIGDEPWSIRCFASAETLHPVRFEASLDGVRAVTADIIQWEGEDDG